MLDKLKTRLAWQVLAITTIVIAVFWLILPWLVIYKILLTITLYILAISIFSTQLGFLLFIFLRPILDFSTNDKLISFSTWNLNFTSLYGLIFIVFALVVVFSNYSEFKKLAAKNIILFWLLFFVWGAASFIWSFSKSTSLVELARLFSFFVSFLLGLILIKTNKNLTTLIKYIIFSALIPLAVAFYQFVSYSGLIEGDQNRLFATFAHPNMLAFFIVFIITLATFIWLNIKKTRVELYIYLLLSLVLLLVLAGTYTRGAYLVLLLIILIIGLLKYRKFLFVSLVFISLIYIVSLTLQARVNSIFQADPYGSISWRITLWQDEISYIHEAPIIGHGVGLASLVIANHRDWTLGSPEPHNDFLRIALDTGLVGLILYVLLIISLLWQLIRNYFRTTAPRLKMLNLFILAFALALYGASTADNILNDTALQWSFWALLGGLMAVQIKKSPNLSK